MGEPTHVTRSTLPISDYCREIEGYLCRKNDGHLIRVVGPSFDLVSGWEAQGIPFRVACTGIDRYFERRARKLARPRPVKIDFCQADVLDAFDEWRRVVGAAVGDIGADGDGRESGPSLPAHLERALMRLTSARASGRLGESFERVIDAVAGELDAARTAGCRGLRGERRREALERLAALDRELIRLADAELEEAARSGLVADAERELNSFRARMTPEALTRARDAVYSGLLRERYGLPILTFQ